MVLNYLSAFSASKLQKMQLFYADNRTADVIVLDESESKHCVQVLRKKPGDDVLVLDGKGGWFRTTLMEAHKRKCVLAVKEEKYAELPAAQLHIGIAPTKNISRMEWFVEKATELGIREISLLQCQRSERKVVKVERLQRIAIAAMKQSLNLHLPEINELQPFGSWIEALGSDDRKLIAHCMPGKKRHLKHALMAGENAILLIGPEGDFSEVEVSLAKMHGFEEISLGKSRLRTETAAVAASVFFNWQNDLE